MKPSVTCSVEEGVWYSQGQASLRAIGNKGWPARLHALCSCALRPCATAILGVLLIKLALVGLVAAWPGLHRAGQNGFRAVFYGTDPMLFGRNEGRFPASRCCTGAACVRLGASSRVAVLTYIRSDAYLPLLKQLECSFRKSNPGVELGVMTVAGELGPEARQWIAGRNLTVVEVKPLFYPNYHTPRYGQNWLKLRVYELTQFDAVLLIDSDTIVLGNITPLFSLPVDFAAVWDQNKWLGRFNTRLPGGLNGGVLFVRPCPAVGQHMIDLLNKHPKLRFSHGAAEQDFFNWYYRYTGMMLPLEYNAMASDSLRGNLTIGGNPPVVVHFTQHKPFHGAVPGRPGHQLLCNADELRRR